MRRRRKGVGMGVRTVREEGKSGDVCESRRKGARSASAFLEKERGVRIVREKTKGDVVCGRKKRV